MPAAPVPRYGLRGRVVTMYAARTVLSDGIVWVAEGSISHVTTAGDRPAAHAGSPVIPTAGTIYPGMIELHNHLAYNTLPLFKIPRRYARREEWQGTVGYRRYVSGPAGVIASVPELIRATIRYVECKSLIAGTTTPQGLTLRAAPIKHLYQGIVRNAELPDAAGLPPARPKIGDVTPTASPRSAGRWPERARGSCTWRRGRPRHRRASTSSTSFPGRPVHATCLFARRRITHSQRQLHPPAAEVIDRHGRLGERDWLAEVQAGDQGPHPDTTRLRGHHGQRRRTIEHRVPRPIWLHDGVTVPQHVEPKLFGVPPPPSQSI